MFAERAHYLVSNLIHGRVAVLAARRLGSALVQFRSQPRYLVAQIRYDRSVLVHLEGHVQDVSLDFVRDATGPVQSQVGLGLQIERRGIL